MLLIEAGYDYPMCDDCVRFAGDENFKVVPVVGRTITITLPENRTYSSICVKLNFIIS